MIPLLVIAGLVGNDVTQKSLEWVFYDRIRPVSKQLLAMKAAGQDTAELDLESLPKRRQTGKGGQTSFSAFHFVCTHNTTALHALLQGQLIDISFSDCGFYG